MEYGANGHRVNGVLGVSRAIGYCGMPDFADLVPSLSDSLIVRRDASKPAFSGCTLSRGFVCFFDCWMEGALFSLPSGRSLMDSMDTFHWIYPS